MPMLVKFYQSHPGNPGNPENPDSDKFHQHWYGKMLTPLTKRPVKRLSSGAFWQIVPIAFFHLSDSNKLVILKILKILKILIQTDYNLNA